METGRSTGLAELAWPSWWVLGQQETLFFFFKKNVDKASKIWHLRFSSNTHTLNILVYLYAHNEVKAPLTHHSLGTRSHTHAQIKNHLHQSRGNSMVQLLLSGQSAQLGTEPREARSGLSLADLCREKQRAR